MKSNGLFGLEDLVAEDSFALFDNNILVGPLQRPGKNSSREEKISYIGQSLDFYANLIRSIREGSNFFITDGVWEEYHTFQSEVRNPKKDYGLRKAQRTLTRNRRKLAAEFKKNDRILRLGDSREREIYSDLREYSSFLAHSFGVSKIDLDLLFSGIAISNTRGPTSLISNDFGVHRSWHYLEEEGFFSEGQLRYFIKEDFDGYRLLL